MKLPAWFPYPRAWQRTFIASFLGLLSLVFIRIFSFWGRLTIPISPLFFFFILGIGSFIPFIFFIFPYNHYFSDYPKKWSKSLPAPNSIRESITLYTGFYISLVTTGFIVIPLIPLSRYERLVFYSQSYREFNDTVYSIFGAIYFIITLYLFHIDLLLSRKSVVSKKKAEPIQEKRKPNESSAETKIAMELEKLKNQLGNNHKSTKE